MQQEMKSFFAVALLTVFGILMTNNLVLATPVAEWGLAGGFFVLAALFVVWASLPERAEASTDLALNEDIAPKAQEWIISKDILPDGSKRVQLVGNEALPFDTLAESEANA